MVEKAQADVEVKPYEVWPEHWPAVRMFLRLSTQWVVAGMGGLVGINYSSVEVLFRIYRVKNPRRMLEKIQIMEAAALRYIAASRKEK